MGAIAIDVPSSGSDEAANYDAKHEKATAEIVRRIEARRDFIGVDWIKDDSSDDEGDAGPTRAVRVLDYACGTGAMSRVGLSRDPVIVALSETESEQAFAPYTTQCVGIDLSEKMVDAYNTRARNQVRREAPVVRTQRRTIISLTCSHPRRV